MSICFNIVVVKNFSWTMISPSIRVWWSDLAMKSRICFFNIHSLFCASSNFRYVFYARIMFADLSWFSFQLGLKRLDQYTLALDTRLKSPHGRTNHRNWVLVNLSDILHLTKGPPHLSCSTFRWNTCWPPVTSARLHSKCTNCPLPAGISRSQRIHPSIPLQ